MDIDLPVSRVRGTLTLNGRALPMSTSRRAGTIVFSARGQRSESRLDIGTRGRASFDIAVIKGVYDVWYEPAAVCNATEDFPCSRATIASGVSFEQDRDFDIDVRSVRAMYSVYVDGSPIVAPNLSLALHNDAGDSALLPMVSEGAGIPVWPGRYAVFAVQNSGCSDSSDVCVGGALASNVEFVDETPRRIDAASSSIELSLSLDGARWPTSSRNPAQFALTDRDGRRSVIEARSSALSLRVLRGHYLVSTIVSPLEPCDPRRSAVCNEGPVGEFDATEPEQRVRLDAQSVLLSGRVTVDDVTPIGGGLGREGLILLRRGARTESVRVGVDGRFEFRVIKHTRGALAFESLATACLATSPIQGLACGGALIAEEHEFTADRSYDAALRSHGPRISVTHDGAVVREDPSVQSLFTFTPSAGGRAINVRLSSEFPMRLIEGGYDVRLSAGPVLRWGVHQIARGRRVSSSDEIAFAVRTRSVSGRILHNGEAQPQRLFNVPIVWFFLNGERSTDSWPNGSPVSYSAMLVDAPTSIMVGQKSCTLDELDVGVFCGNYWVTNCP